uniref:integrin alpha-D-like isoform X2 n=1 Tax=Pristiophorus japonicus TaxID=55135 RepID=UPI00398F3251
MYQNGVCYLFNSQLEHVNRFPPQTQDCFTARVDLAFLIDGSGSIVPEDFSRIKDFMVAMLRRFHHRDAQFAVMQFSHLTKKEFNFKEFEWYNRSEALVTQIQQIKGDTYTPTAIKTIVEDIFVEHSGLRANSRRVMVVITDGKSNDPGTTFTEAIAQAEGKHILRFAVGFAVMQFSHLTKKELNFEEFEWYNRSEALVTQIQQIKGDTYTPTAIKTIVEDIFVEHSGLRANSRRVMVVITDGKSNDPGTTFTEAIAQAEGKHILRFAVGFAVMQFSHLTKKELNFEEFEWYNRSEALVTQIQQIKGDTYTPTAIKTIVEDIFVEHSGLRANSRRVMVVITDGKSNDPGTTFTEAIAQAEGKHILRFAVGVGPDFQSADGRRELTLIASNSTNDTVFSVQNYAALGTIQEMLQAKIFAIEGAQGIVNTSSFVNEMSQEGFSSLLTSDTVVLGSLGAYGWSGGLLLYRGHKQIFINISSSDKDIRNSYLGYSVQEATRSGEVFYVAGAPRYQHRGEVIVFRQGVNGSWEDGQHIPGEQIGSYFGSELCTVDLTGDGETDLLLIGAPLYHDHGIGGIVIICTMSPQGTFSCPGTLRGEAGNDLGRFGSSIAALRDLNGDGLGDVAVGAPMEDEHRGSVYIYHGQRSGVSARYSQRVAGGTYSRALRYFGQSLSGALDVSGDTLPDLVVGALGMVAVFRSRPVLNVSLTVAFDPGNIAYEAYECRRSVSADSPITNTTVCFTVAKTVADKLGVLGANITYSLLLDEGRQKGRATFQTLSWTLTRSMRVYGRRRCHRHQILLTSCVEDYFLPIEVSINFTVAGEVIQGTKGLRPILNEYSKTSHSVKLPFEKDCGADGGCVDHLRLFFNFSGGDTVEIGRTAVLIVGAMLENAKDDSYKTQLDFRHPARLAFRKISSVQPSSVHIECGDLQNLRGIETGTLTCRVNHPIFQKGSRVTFDAVFDIGTSGSEEQTENFTISASRAEYTRHVNFNAGRWEARTVKHSYKVENLGLRTLAVGVTFTVPVRVGARMLWNVTVSERKPGTRSICQPAVESVAVPEGAMSADPRDYIVLLKVRKLGLPSKVVLSYDEAKYVDVWEGAGQYKQATILTEVDILEGVNHVPLIVGGSVGGLVLLLILVVLFYKAGFFNRRNNAGDGDSPGERASEDAGPSAEGETIQE